MQLFNLAVVFFSPCLVAAETVRATKVDGVFPLLVERAAIGLRDRLQPRSDDALISVALFQESGSSSWYTNISVGSPAQQMVMLMDTGSSDTWVNARTSVICQSSGKSCSTYGSYEANSSKTYRYVSSDFSGSYYGGNATVGDYASDIFYVARSEPFAQQFGIAYNSSTFPYGIIGLGLEDLEFAVMAGRQNTTSNFPQALVDAHIIKTNAYSLYTDQANISRGAFIFGGVDQDKYVGSLQTLSAVKASFPRLSINLTSMNIASNSTSRNITISLPAATNLDSGSFLSYLPVPLVASIYSFLGIPFDVKVQIATCDCSLRTQANAALSFSFGPITISVPFRDLVIDYDDKPGCFFAIAPTMAINLLGDSFFRSAYVVFDLANREISLAQARVNSTSSNITAINPGLHGIPGAMRAYA